jgi:RTX calcium-binding nonapeptide repeat (4 copies)
MSVRGALASLAALAALSALGVARAAELTGTERADRLVGTRGADTIRGRGGNDRIEGGGGPDVLNGGTGRDTVLGQAGADGIALHADSARDAATCGTGLDVVNAELQDVVADDCEIVTRQLSRDPFTGPGQHETQVEPDSASFGSTLVTVFQTGRLTGGGAEGTGWATSVDAGRTWRRGFLARANDRVSDPVVAYDRRHRTWLIATLGVAATAAGEAAQLLVSRSADGVSWSRSEVAADDPTEDYDKEWTVCDNWPASRFYGTCYLVYLEIESGEIRTRSSADGGRQWSAPIAAPVASPEIRGNGAFPVVRPDGALLVLYSVYGSTDPSQDAIMAARSVDGGLTFETARPIAQLFTEDVAGIRSPPFVSADVDGSGTIYATWSDCRFSTQCTANSIVLSTSRDGVTWTTPRRVPFGPTETGLDRFVPALAVDPATTGARAGVAIAAYSAVQAQGCVPCEAVDAFLVTSVDGGRTWQPPQRLNAESMSPSWVAERRASAACSPTTSRCRSSADAPSPCSRWRPSRQSGGSSRRSSRQPASRFPGSHGGPRG